MENKTTPHESSPFLKGGQESKSKSFFFKHKKFIIPSAIMLLLLPLLGLIALKDRHHAHASFTSPIVYPSPQGYGAGNWSSAYEKARAMVSQMSLGEMNNVTLGIQSTTGCVGTSAGAPRLGFNGLCLHDAGNGVRDTDGVSGFASGLHIGASWNASLALARGLYMGAEFKRKGVNVALGPVVGPIGRIAAGGRNWEGFASDPYLSGILGAQSVIGLQQSVIASIKHFVGNEQETNRNPGSTDGNDITLSTSANIDDQTMHELYLWPFQDLVRAGAGCVMCSYNRINGTYACENSKAMNGLLKGELNFQGFVVSDWTGQHSGIPSADGGLDMAMPTTNYWNERQLENAVNSGALNETRLADMATRILATWIQFGQDGPTFPALGVGMAPNLLLPHTYVDARDPASKASLLQQAIEGHVLVKNVDSALPLSKPKVMSIFGYDATVQASLNPDPQGLFQQNWEAVNLQQPQLSSIASNTPVANPPTTHIGVLTVGGGSGSNTPPYISAPFEAIQERAYLDSTEIFYDFASTDPDVVASSDTCLVFINEYASETWDRFGLADVDSDTLVNNVASSCNNTIVVIHNAGIRTVDAWIDNVNVTAVIFAHLPGQDAGRALVQILYGAASPSGRLPYTVAKQQSDCGNLLGPCQAHDLSPQCDFTEGVNIDYRSFLARNITPRYEFGYGLTYTTFEYSSLQVDMNATSTSNDTVLAPVYANGTTDQNQNNTNVGIGGLLSLFESVGTVSASIKNTESVVAAEVAQLYIQIPAAPSNSSNPTTRVLRGFEKVTIEPGATTQIAFNLRSKDISSWDVVRQAWVIPSGSFEVMVGKSVLDLPLSGSFTL